MMTAAAIAKSVATERKIPALARVVDEDPFPEITSADTSAPLKRKTTPGVANFRAAVEEK
jgi:predicted TIM-barrel enzyme